MIVQRFEAVLGRGQIDFDRRIDTRKLPVSGIGPSRISEPARRDHVLFPQVVERHNKPEVEVG